MSAVRLWNTSYGDYTDKEPEPCGCDADPDHGPHHQDGTRIREFIALPAAEHAALVALLGEARNTIFALRKTCNPYYIALDPGCIENRIDAALAGLEGCAK